MYSSGIRYSESVREFQSVFILTVLREQRANQVRAAQKLGMHRKTFRRIIRNFELDIRPLRPSTRRPPLSERAVPVQTKARATSLASVQCLCKLPRGSRLAFSTGNWAHNRVNV